MYDNKYIHGLDLINENLNQYKEFVKDKVVFGGIILIGKILDRGIIKNINLTDHTLRELAKMGHPYAKRNPQMIHTPEYLVHKQSGELRSSFYSYNYQDYIKNRTAHVAGVDENKAPHAKFVIMGTSKMVPRDFLGGTLQEKAQEMRDEFINFMKKTRFRKAAKK